MTLTQGIKQRSPEWYALRRQMVTSTMMPVILGESPYQSEATLARNMLAGVEQPETLVMRGGRALEPVIQAEYEQQKKVKLRRFHGIVSHPDLPWAAASPDWWVVGERWLVEGKTTQSRRWDGDEVPQDIESQVRWTMGVTGYPVSDVAVLLHSAELRIYTVEHDAAIFANMVAIAADFRRRLAEGGPFAEDAASVKARYPADDGTEIEADAELNDAVVELLRLRALRRETTDAEERIEAAIKSRMGPATRLNGAGYSITWKRAKDSELTDWRLVADGLLRQLPETERAALVGLHSTVREGARYFRVQVGKGDSE